MDDRGIQKHPVPSAQQRYTGSERCDGAWHPGRVPGVMTRGEMLAMYFYARRRRYEQMAHQGPCSIRLLDMVGVVGGYDPQAVRPWLLGRRFHPSAANMHEHCIKVDAPTTGFLFAVEAQTLQERQQARRDTIGDRVSACAAIVNASKEQLLVWCNLNDESSALAAAIPDAVEVRGSDSDDHKEKAIAGFLDGSIRALVSKLPASWALV